MKELTPKEYAWMAYNIYHESRSEPWEGLVAVAHVVFNRSERRGKDVIQIIRAPKQFSWHNGNKFPPIKDFKSYLKCLGAVEQAIIDRQYGYNLQDADHYFADYMPVFPSWSKGMMFVQQIGVHRFYCSGR